MERGIRRYRVSRNNSLVEIGEFRKKIRGVTKLSLSLGLRVTQRERWKAKARGKDREKRRERRKGKSSRSNAERTQYFSIRKSETH